MAEAAPIFQICTEIWKTKLYLYLSTSNSATKSQSDLRLEFLRSYHFVTPSEIGTREEGHMRWSWLYFIIKFVTFLSPLQLSWSKFIILRRNLLSLHYDSLVVKITQQILPRTSLIRHKNKPIRSEP